MHRAGGVIKRKQNARQAEGKELDRWKLEIEEITGRTAWKGKRGPWSSLWNQFRIQRVLGSDAILEGSLLKAHLAEFWGSLSEFLFQQCLNRGRECHGPLHRSRGYFFCLLPWCPVCQLNRKSGWVKSQDMYLVSGVDHLFESQYQSWPHNTPFQPPAFRISSVWWNQIGIQEVLTPRPHRAREAALASAWRNAMNGNNGCWRQCSSRSSTVQIMEEIEWPTSLQSFSQKQNLWIYMKSQKYPIAIWG